MDELLKTIILGAPNTAVAIGMLFWASKVIDRQIEATGRLVDRLIEVLAENDRLKQQIAERKDPF